MKVTPWSPISEASEAAPLSPISGYSNRLPPANSGVRQLPIRPWPKWVGSIESAAASAPSPMWARLSATRAITARQLSTTPLGVPVVPEVKRTSAGSSRPKLEQSGHPSAAAARSRPAQTSGAELVASTGVSASTSTSAGAMKSTVLASSGAARPGFRQAAQAPTDQAAKRSAKNAGVPPWAMATMAPGPTPSRTRSAARAATSAARRGPLQTSP